MARRFKVSLEASFDYIITKVGLPRICLVCHQLALAPQMS